MTEKFSYSTIIDISLPLTAKTVVYPGTPNIEIEKRTSETTHMTLSAMKLSSHTGTHIDAPSHAFEDGDSLDAISLSTFIGTARVLDCTQSVGSVSLEDIKRHDPQKGERLLLKTSNSARGFDEFYPDFVYLSSGAASHLAEIGIALIGIDSLSIKQRGSQDNIPHTAFLSKGVPIVEGLNLSSVDEGNYTLVVLPLNFVGIDGAPARAILLS